MTLSHVQPGHPYAHASVLFKRVQGFHHTSESVICDPPPPFTFLFHLPPCLPPSPLHLLPIHPHTSCLFPLPPSFCYRSGLLCCRPECCPLAQWQAESRLLLLDAQACARGEAAGWLCGWEEGCRGGGRGARRTSFYKGQRGEGRGHEWADEERMGAPRTSHTTYRIRGEGQWGGQWEGRRVRGDGEGIERVVRGWGAEGRAVCGKADGGLTSAGLTGFY